MVKEHRKCRHLTFYLVIAHIVLFCACAAPTSAIEFNIPRPGDREFVRDLADMIDSADEQRIREMCDKLLTAKATPIIVVTIISMANYDQAGMRIETFAKLLFDQWQIGHAKLGDQTWNTGILLLISKDDRKARIELGAGWGHEKNAICDQIMQDHIIARFKRGDFSAGIMAGVEGLDRMARELKLPTIARPWWHYALIIGFIGLAVFTIVSLIRRRASGWAWLLWAAVFSLVGFLLYQFLTSRGSSGGGGFSGGSFGGGFSGGGGSTGSW
jgi:uncharacterized protein